MIPSHEMFVGALVTWMHTPRGGYGFSYPVPAKVVGLSLSGERARIEVQKRDGTNVRRTVSHQHLCWRKAVPRDSARAACVDRVVAAIRPPAPPEAD